MRLGALLAVFFLFGPMTACGPAGLLSDIEQDIDSLRIKSESFTDTSATGRLLSYLESSETLVEQLSRLEPDLRTDEQRKKHQLLRRKLHDIQRRLQAYREDPSLYNIGGHLKRLLVQSDRPLPQRIDTIRQVLQSTPAYYRKAREKVDQPAAGKLELAIRKQRAGLRFLNRELLDSLQNSPPDKTVLSTLNQELKGARLAIKDYLAWCNSKRIEQVQMPEIQ